MRYPIPMKFKRNPRQTALLLTLLIAALPLLTAASWDFDKRSIARDEIMSGGPPRDGIPALATPKFVTAAQAT